MDIVTRFGGFVANPSSRRTSAKVRAAMVMTPPPDPPPGGTGTPTPEMITFAGDFVALAEPTHAGMALDPDMQREMVLATGTLAPRANCAYVAVQNGNWTNPETWLRMSDNQFAVPVAGARIGIPAGIAVTYDSNATTVYDYIRYDGILQFVTNANTQLYVDTIIGGHSSQWVQGTEAEPISAAYTSIVEFPDGGDLDSTVDTLLLGRGWIAMGDVQIWGAAKTPFVECHQTRIAGDTSLTLDSAPTGWASGDEVTITGTGEVFLFDPNVDHRVIDTIGGTALTITAGLTHPRDLSTIRADPDFTDAVYWVGNFSRNIKFRSPPGTAIHRRGHMMWMHSTVNARYFEANLLGRTRKDIPSWDATNDAKKAELNVSGNWAADGGDAAGSGNVRGRYNVHLHKAGTGAGEVTAQIVGAAASDAPGWLYAHHSSFANFTDCVGRRFVGAGMMAENGDEVGTWDGCLMAGAVPIVFGPEKGAADVVNGDFGRYGSGYWWRSRVVKIQNCIASDTGRAYVWMSRGNQVNPFTRNTPEPRIFYGQDTIAQDKPILEMLNCKASCSQDGMTVIKANQNQGHTYRSRFFDLLFVNCQTGIGLDYTGKYSFKNMRMYAPPSGQQGSPVGFAQSTVDMVFENLTYAGRYNAIFAEGNGPGMGTDFDNTFINVVNKSTTAATFVETQSFLDGKIIVLDTADITPTTLTWVPSTEPHVDMASEGRPTWVSDGIVTGSLYTKNRNYQSIGMAIVSWNVVAMLRKYGYYTYTHPTHGASRYIVVPDVLVDRILDVNGDFQTRYLSFPLRVTNYDTQMAQQGVVNKGALPTRYVDAIALGDAGIPDPGTPDPNAAAYVVYEDIFAPGGLYEGFVF